MGAEVTLTDIDIAHRVKPRIPSSPCTFRPFNFHLKHYFKVIGTILCYSSLDVIAH